MKKRLAVYTVVLVGLTVIMGIFGNLIIRDAYESEMMTIWNIAGKVIPAYPETEAVFMKAVADSSKSGLEEGVRIMTRYGYHAEDLIRDYSVYRQRNKTFFLILGTGAAVSAAAVYGFFLWTDRERKKQEQTILLFLNACLCDDYGRMEDICRQNVMGNPLIEDALKQIGANLQIKTEYLEAEHDRTKTLVTDISHQLKTPVSALKTCFALCAEADCEEEREEFLNRCRVQMDKLEMLVESLVRVSHLETGIIDLRPENASLREIIAEAVNIVYIKLLKKNMEICTDDFEDICLNLDKKWTAEAISNVFDNAVKYAPEGSRITVRVRKLHSFARIEIEDMGIGITKEEQTKIFGRFYRGNHDTVKNTEGSGVGLYLSREILERQNGAISVRPAGDTGSIFIIRLPL